MGFVIGCGRRISWLQLGCNAFVLDCFERMRCIYVFIMDGKWVHACAFAL
jgi:hypothetical protein